MDKITQQDIQPNINARIYKDKPRVTLFGRGTRPPCTRDRDLMSGVCKASAPVLIIQFGLSPRAHRDENAARPVIHLVMDTISSVWLFLVSTRVR